MTVRAVIPTWNRRDLVLQLLENLKQQTRPPTEIVVADNGSTDGTAEALPSSVRLIRQNTNLGFARAVNAGARDATTDWLAILNNDVTLAPNWLEQLTSTGAAFATGKILQAHDPGKIDGVFDLLSRGATAWRAGYGEPVHQYEEPRDILLPSFTAVLIRTSVFHELGGLDEQYGSYYEDVDFGLRAALAGHHGRYIPSAIAHHLGSATLGAWHPDTVRLISRNQLLLARKHFPLWRFACPLIVAQGLWGLVAARRGRFGAWLRGKWQGARTPLLTPPRKHPRLEEVIHACERELRSLEAPSQSPYWRWYFRLTRGAR